MNRKRQLIVPAASIVIILSVLKKRKIKRKRIWVKEWLLKHGTESPFGAFHENVYPDWMISDPERYRRTMRMSTDAFSELVDLVTPYIKKYNTHLRKSIPVDKRLAITLKYLASGDTFYDLSSFYCVGVSTIQKIIYETCQAINIVLRSKIQIPTTSAEWKV